MNTTKSAQPESAHGRLARILTVAGALVLLAIAVGSYVAWRNGVQFEALSAMGYPGVFLVMVISGGSMFLSGPGQASVVAAGAILNPALVGIAAGLGNATGELTGYIAGRAGATVFEGREPPRWWTGIQNVLSRYGFPALVLLALVPNPVFDAIGVFAGSAAFPIKRFWIACALGNSVKYALLASLGAIALPF